MTIRSRALSLLLISNLTLVPCLAEERSHQTFEDLFNSAKENHFMYQASVYQTQAARSSLAAARAKYLPTVSFDANLNYINKTDEIAGTKTKSEMWQYNYGQFSASVPLFSKALKQLKILKEFALKSSQLNQNLVEQSFMVTFVDLYGNMVMLETNRNIQLGTVNFLKKLIDEKVSGLEENNPIRLQMEFTYHQVNLAFQTFMNQYHALKNQFEGIIGMSLDGLYLNEKDSEDIEISYPAPIDFNREEKAKFAASLVEKAQDANGGNVQFKLAALQYEQAKVMAETAKLWDINVYAHASYGISMLDNDALGDTLDTDTFTAGLGVSIPVFDAGYRHQVRESFYQMLAVQEQYKQQKRQLEVQAKTIVTQLESAYRGNRAYTAKVLDRSLEDLIEQQQKRFKDVLDDPNSDLAAILAELQSFQLSTQAIQLSSAAYKDIVVNNLKLKLFTGEITESDITYLSDILTQYVPFKKLDQSIDSTEEESAEETTESE